MEDEGLARKMLMLHHRLRPGEADCGCTQCTVNRALVVWAEAWKAVGDGTSDWLPDPPDLYQRRARLEDAESALLRLAGKERGA